MTAPFQYDPIRASTLVPRPYQRTLIDALRAATAIHQPGARLAVVVATGGGKQLIANDFIAQARRRVLCVTKDWTLLRQGALDLATRYVNASLHMGYVGDGEADEKMAGLAKTASAQVVFTTLKTFVARRNRDFAREHFQYIIIDEVHWGEHAGMQRKLYERYKSEAVFIGFTATPRVNSEYSIVGEKYDFARLLSLGYLSKPVVHPAVHTCVKWDPELSMNGGDIATSSLRALGQDGTRNRIIIDTYIQNERAFGKTIVFACDIIHCDELLRLFDVAGVSAGAIHSNMPREQRAEVLEQFKLSALDVLVNVAVLTHGVDIPDIRTVILARPTTSDILFAQMIGRAARLAPGKTLFRIVDFVDNVGTHGVMLQRLTVSSAPVAQAAAPRYPGARRTNSCRRPRGAPTRRRLRIYRRFRTAAGAAVLGVVPRGSRGRPNGLRRARAACTARRRRRIHGGLADCTRSDSSGRVDDNCG